MEPPIYVTSPQLNLPAGPGGPPTSELSALMRRMIQLQEEQVALLKAQRTAQDTQSRLRAFLTRWQGEFPNVGQQCKDVLPAIERAYLSLVQELLDRAGDEEQELESEFTLNEFLDRYGNRLGQLGAVLSQLGPLADAAPTTP